MSTFRITSCLIQHFWGGHEPINLLDLVKLLIDLHGSGEFEIIPFPPEKKRIDIGDYYGNYQKFANLTGWNPKTSLKDGFTKMISYYKQYLDQYVI